MSAVAWLLDQLGAAIVYGGVGLLVGWNVLPQPAFVKATYDKVIAYVKSKID
jgi:hypothetical protein